MQWSTKKSMLTSPTMVGPDHEAQVAPGAMAQVVPVVVAAAAVDTVALLPSPLPMVTFPGQCGPS